MNSSGPANRRVLFGLVISVTALVLGSITPALASPVEALGNPADHWAGSQVRRHQSWQSGGQVGVEATTLPGLDVSGWQGNVDWNSVAANGATFAYVKATEGTTYQNPYFGQQYDGSYRVGLIRGAYHFARPDVSGATAQADFFATHGGGWSRDGMTLPPMLDIEYAPSGDRCYGLSQESMRGWINEFSNRMRAHTSRWVTIYTTLDWWSTCTGNWGGLGGTNPLFIARYATSAGTLPAGWSFWTFWQHTDHGTFPGDQDYFSAGADRLKALANNG